jgi:hypothetical protein
MPSILIVEKLGNIKSSSLKNWDEGELYKKAGLKSADGFKCYTVWNVEIEDKAYSIHLYGKTTGRANQENKYEFPPPVDSTLFFGNCVLVNKTAEGVVTDITNREWDTIYEHLFGGFEDLGDEDSEDDEDSDDEPGVKRTKDGYVKDGFVVGDDDEDSDDDDEEGSEGEEDEEPVYAKKTKKSSGSSKIKSVFELKEVESETYLDCTSELSEESYIE